jgi:hypothetical protein
MRRRTLLVVLAALAVLVAAGVVVLWPRADRITEENCGRIHEGMTPTEVEAILGPPGDYRSGPTKHPLMHATQTEKGQTMPISFLYLDEIEAPKIQGETTQKWLSDHGDVHVYYDSTGFVRGRTFWSAQPKPQGLLDNLLWRAQRQWHRWFPE